MQKQVAVEVSGINFAAAHFVSEGGTCERLHGHNYQVTVSINGEVSSHGMVIDFRVLKQRLRHLCNQWDHQILLPTKSQVITINQQKSQTQVTTPNGTYSFPSKDVTLLDLVETTAEEIARLLCQQLIEDLKADYPKISRVRVILAESSTSRAIVTLSV